MTEDQPVTPGQAPVTEEVPEENVAEDTAKFVAKGMKIIHGPDTRDALVNKLKTKNPVQAVSEVVIDVTKRLDASARQEGKEIADKAKLEGAVEIFGQVIEVGETAGVLEMDEKQKQLSLSLAIQNYIDAESKAGRIDKQALGKEMTQQIADMDPEQRKNLNQQLLTINSTAEQMKRGA